MSKTSEEKSQQKIFYLEQRINLLDEQIQQHDQVIDLYIDHALAVVRQAHGGGDV